MLEFVVVAEAEADARLVCDLADRIFLEESQDWIDEAPLPNLKSKSLAAFVSNSASILAKRRTACAMRHVHHEQIETRRGFSEF